MTSSECEGGVLIVDDDADIRDTLRDYLEDNGFEVMLAAHGGEALSLLALGKPCLLLLDLVMPKMDGWELLRRLVAQTPASAFPIYISTSAPEQAPAGYPLLRKPLELSQLLEVVKRHCVAGAVLP